METERYYGLNPVGTRMWVLLSELQDMQSAYERLLDEYDVDPAQLVRDLTGFVQGLAQIGLLTIEREAGASWRA